MVAIGLEIAAVSFGRRAIYAAPLAVATVVSLLPWRVSDWYLNHIALVDGLTFKP